MKEILVAGVGSCGINLTTSYLSLITEEHDLYSKPSPTELQVHFQETQSQNPISRFLFIDRDPFPIDKLLSQPTATLLNQDNLIAGDGSSMNIFANGKRENNTSLFEQTEDVFRKEFEKCESLHGIIINHSLSGGTGSGLACSLLSNLNDNRLIVTNTIVPGLYSREIYENTTLSIYNSILSIAYLVEHASMSIFSDNNALIERMGDQYTDGSWNSMNKYTSKTLSGLTSGTRFTGIQPLNLRKILINCIPFPRVHFFSSNYYEDCYNRRDFIDFTQEKVLKNQDSLLKFPSSTGPFISSSAQFFRGIDYASSELEQINKNSLVKVYDYIPNGTCLVGHVNKVCKNNTKEATYLNMGPYIGEYMKKLSESFGKFFRRKSFVHWYTNAGMDEMEFIDAESNVNDLSSEYMLFGGEGYAYVEGDDLEDE